MIGGGNMRLKWGEEKVYRISKKVPKAERENEWGEWSWWALFAVLVMMIAIFIAKVKGVI